MSLTFTVTASPDPNSGVQLTYPLNIGLGHEGQLADLQAYISRSYINQSGLPLAFGTLAALNQSPGATSEYAIAPVTAATNVIVGLNVDANTFEGATGSAYQARAGYYPNPAVLADGRIGTPDKQVANIVSKGNVLVYTTDITTKMGDPIRFYINDVSASIPGAFLGRFCISPVAGKTIQITEGARWLSSATGNLAQLEIDIPATKYTAD